MIFMIKRTWDRAFAADNVLVRNIWPYIHMLHAMKK